MDYNNPIVGFCNNPGGSYFNVITHDNAVSDLPFGQCQSKQVRIDPVGAVVKRVVLFGGSGGKFLYSIEFYDRDNVLLLKAGRSDHN